MKCPGYRTIPTLSSRNHNSFRNICISNNQEPLSYPVFYLIRIANVTDCLVGNLKHTESMIKNWSSLEIYVQWANFVGDDKIEVSGEFSSSGKQITGRFVFEKKQKNKQGTGYQNTLENDHPIMLEESGWLAIYLI
ncbi:hypothetical protein CAEBREN_06389 [Caenorhabditis brenneri]|uniref:Uncharacterized protein n=1 Tax=Caenorhabditis brenneri TaxID=135651 RepID=G0MH03_CAEBE|nr:hypothetical protein CAEBREN_06389 [Caenorhabditis brenneri]